MNGPGDAPEPEDDGVLTVFYWFDDGTGCTDPVLPSS